MAKVTVVGSAMVVTSSKTLDDIKKIEKYRPKALMLYSETDGKKEEVFRVGTTSGKGSIGLYGASFGSVSHDANKLATITIDIPSSVVDAAAYAEEVIGTAIINLNRVEASLDSVLASIDDEIEEVRRNIFFGV